MKNINDINKIVSEKLNVSLSLVEKINNNYWFTIREILSNPPNNAIRIKYLGTFYIKEVTLFKKIYATLNILRKIKISQKKLSEYKIRQEYLLREYLRLKKLFNFKLKHKKVIKYINSKPVIINYE